MSKSTYGSQIVVPHLVLQAGSMAGLPLHHLLTQARRLEVRISLDEQRLKRQIEHRPSRHPTLATDRGFGAVDLPWSLSASTASSLVRARLSPHLSQPN